MTEPAAWDEGKPRIITLTMNPALDITTSVDVVRPTENALWRTSLRSRRRRYQCRPHCACPRRLLDSTVPGRRVDREPADGAAR